MQARDGTLRSAAAYIPAVLWAAVLIVVGGSGDLPRLPAVPHLDKVLHFSAYGLLGWLLGTGWVLARRPHWAVLLALALLLGAADEFQQHHTEERMSDWVDWVADALGATTGFFLVARLSRVPAKRERQGR